jgi:hypothetical protein
MKIAIPTAAESPFSVLLSPASATGSYHQFSVIQEKYRNQILTVTGSKGTVFFSSLSGTGAETSPDRAVLLGAAVVVVASGADMAPSQVKSF